MRVDLAVVGFRIGTLGPEDRLAVNWRAEEAPESWIQISDR